MKSVSEVIEGIEYLIANPYDASAAAQEMMDKEIAARKAAADKRKEGADGAETPETAETSEAPDTPTAPKTAKPKKTKPAK